MENKLLAGVDEVGRGCLAAPVVSCALILKKNINKKLLRDSKTITFKNRVIIVINLIILIIINHITNITNNY